MSINPIIPIWIMVIICALLIAAKRKGVWPFVRQIMVALLLFAINLRICFVTEGAPILATDVDVLFVVDNTISMLAEDYGSSDGRRIDAVKEDVADIMEAFAGSRFALITFADESELTVPYTNDADSVLQAVESLEGRTKWYAQGTSLNICYDDLKAVLERNADDLAEGADNAQIVFFISDGEITQGSKLKKFSDLADYIDGGAVLGYGTEDGGKMKVRTYTMAEEWEYLTYYDSNYNEKTAISKIDESNLKDIASDIGVTYFHMTKSSQVNDVVDEVSDILKNVTVEDTGETGLGTVETYWVFAIALGAFLVYDLIYFRRKL